MATYNIKKFTSPEGDVYELSDKYAYIDITDITNISADVYNKIIKHPTAVLRSGKIYYYPIGTTNLYVCGFYDGTAANEGLYQYLLTSYTENSITKYKLSATTFSIDRIENKISLINNSVQKVASSQAVVYGTENNTEKQFTITSINTTAGSLVFRNGTTGYSVINTPDDSATDSTYIANTGFVNTKVKAVSDKFASYLPLSGGTLTGNVTFTNTSNTTMTGSTPLGFYGQTGSNDGWRIVGGGSENAGFLEIATNDDGNEPIYVRQYSGGGGYKGFVTQARTLTLLDGSGNTSIPGSLTVTGSNTVKGNESITGTLSVTGAATLSSTLSVTGKVTANYINMGSIGDTDATKRYLVDNNADGTKYTGYISGIYHTGNALTVTGKIITPTLNNGGDITLPTSSGTLALTSNINNPTITITQNGTTKGTFTLNQSGNTTIALTDTNTDTNTHYTSKNIVGASNTATANAAATNGNVYLNHLEESTIVSSNKIKGAGATTVTSDADGTIIITSTDNNTVYTHPTHTAYASGLYKITTDTLGHVTAATSVTSDDIINLTAVATTSSNGLMSKTDKSKLDHLPTLDGSIKTSWTWGTLLTGNGYTQKFTWDEAGGGSVAFAAKSGQTSMQIDGRYYDQEGKYALIDTNDLSTTLASYSKTGQDATYVKKAGDTMTGTLTLPTLKATTDAQTLKMSYLNSSSAVAAYTQYNATTESLDTIFA